MGDKVSGDRPLQKVYDELEDALKKTSESDRLAVVVRDLELIQGDEVLKHQAIVLIKNVSIMPIGIPEHFQPFSDQEMEKIIVVVKKVGSEKDVEEFNSFVALRVLVKPPGKERAESIARQLKETNDPGFHTLVHHLITKEIAPYDNPDLAFTQEEKNIITPHLKRPETFAEKIISAPSNIIRWWRKSGD